ncbi:hypothetical protein CVT26_009730 [Gymnopilus dilepis]|uniref:Uncharacterized protein n=1 Tax=Gymnopilus dilepis TaxID=231916 RepID=A0A409WCP3_9AGAR|nr:hypothetical protein CVT26_009730 [Gymnopilus dilepis]
MSSQHYSDLSWAFIPVEETGETPAIEHGDLWSMYKMTINGLWTSDSIDVAGDVVSWRGKTPLEVKKGVFLLLDILTETSMLPFHEVIQSVCDEVDASEVQCFFSAQAIIERCHREALCAYRSVVAGGFFDPTTSDLESDSDSDVEAEEKAKKDELVEANCNWLAEWLEEQTTFAQQLIALGVGWRIASCSAYALLVWFIEEQGFDLPGLREIIRLIARDVDNHVDFISLLVYHLADRPTLLEVRRIVAGAIKMEKACATGSLRLKARDKLTDHLASRSLYNDGL